MQFYVRAMRAMRAMHVVGDVKPSPAHSASPGGHAVPP